MAEPSLTPVPKVAAAGIGGAVATIAVWLFGLGGIDVPSLVAAAFTTLAAFGLGYLTPRQGPWKGNHVEDT